MDVIQVELRRRLWHQICHLDFRSAEGKGQEPTVSGSNFTTFLPRNINDEDLLEGANPSTETYDADSFTDMTFHLVRLNGIQCFKEIVRNTCRLGRKVNVNPVAELQTLFSEVRAIVGTMLEKLQTRYLKHCDSKFPLQRLTLGLAALLECGCWVTFWLRIPRAYREAVNSLEIRTMFVSTLV